MKVTFVIAQAIIGNIMQIILTKQESALLLEKREDLYYPFFSNGVFTVPSKVTTEELTSIFKGKSLKCLF